MIRLLEQGQRRPSVSLAESLIRAYGMTDAEAAPVRAAALAGVGRDSPYKRGWRPSPADYKPQQTGRQPMLGPRRQPAEPPQDPPAPASWGTAYGPAPDGEDNPWTAVYGDPADPDPLQRLGALRASPSRRA